MKEYVDQSHKELRLAVFNQHINTESLSLLASSPEVEGKLSAQAHVIGASHVVTASYEGKTFIELFACFPYEDLLTLGAKPLLYRDNVFNPDLKLSDASLSVGYDFSAEKVSLEEGARDIRYYSDCPAEPQAIYDFGRDERFPTNAATAVVIRAILNYPLVVKPYKLRIKSCHLYPNENVAIKTISTINFNPER
jgi:hypothetical protein